ncbi:MAG: apolipoprotein N-acyltransferase [Deltaproteobacteria bacterium]|nr:apolipoprotein N-acyltransferase [Deltaproteobacteria bacterium]
MIDRDPGDDNSTPAPSGQDPEPPAAAPRPRWSRRARAAIDPGWRHGLLLLGAALASALAQPLALPVEPATEFGPRWLLSLLAFVGPGLLMIAVRDVGPRRAYWYGLLYAAAQFAVVFNWIAIPIVVFGRLPLVVGVAGWLGVVAILAPILALAPWLARRIETQTGLHPVLVWPVAWTAVEYLRNYFPLGGFPWGNIGASQTGNSVVLQLASLFGGYGLTFLVVTVNATWVLALVARRAGRPWPRLPIAVVASALLLTVGYGLWRLHALDVAQRSAPTLTVAIVQGNIEQGIKNKAELHAPYILDKYQKLTAAARATGAKLIVWPESAHPAFFDRSAATLAGRGFGDPSADVYTAAGVVFYFREGAAPGNQVFLHNSVVVLGPELDVVGRYHKQRLVPFGEYVPWPLGILLGRLVPGAGQFRPGTLGPPTPVHGARVAGLICYEGIFPQFSRGFVRLGANLLVNVTNDHWYGWSAAPHQHLAFYSLRAVENGRSIVRAANAGISAFIGPDGGVHQPSALFEDAVLARDVTLHEARTLYTIVGDAVAQLSALATLFAFGLGWWRAGRLKSRVPKRPQSGEVCDGSERDPASRAADERG